MKYASKNIKMLKKHDLEYVDTKYKIRIFEIRRPSIIVYHFDKKIRRKTKFEKLITVILASHDFLNN